MTGSPDNEPPAAHVQGAVPGDVVAVLAGDGASLLATRDQVVILRDGTAFRPRTGVRSWSYDRILDVSLSQARHGQARIVIRTGRFPWEAVSMFFSSRNLPDAERMIREIRKRLRTSPRP